MFTIDARSKMILLSMSSKYRPKLSNYGAANRITLQNGFDLEFFQNDRKNYNLLGSNRGNKFQSNSLGLSYLSQTTASTFYQL